VRLSVPAICVAAAYCDPWLTEPRTITPIHLLPVAMQPNPVRVEVGRFAYSDQVFDAHLYFVGRHADQIR
jgi:hypothetical protein